MLDVPSFAFDRLDRRIGVFWDDVEETMRGHILLVAALLGSGCAPGSSGWVVSLEGRVVDAFNNGIQNAGVEVRSRAGGAELGAIRTDSAGYWRLPLYVESGQEGVSWPLAIEAEAPGLQAGVSYWIFPIGTTLGRPDRSLWDPDKKWCMASSRQRPWCFLRHLDHGVDSVARWM